MSQLWSCVSSPSSAGNGGESALELCVVAVFCGEVVLSSSAGNGGESASGGAKGARGASQLWSWVLLSSVFFFWGARGASQLPGCEGEGGMM